MNTSETIDPLEVKSRSEAIVTEAGGQICDWLPVTEISEARELGAVVDRALILNAMLQIHFGAPTQIIAQWIEGQSLQGALTPKEKTLLAKPTKSLTEQERTDLFWNIESLWAILWPPAWSRRWLLIVAWRISWPASVLICKRTRTARSSGSA
jgi:hypothetical protein